MSGTTGDRSLGIGIIAQTPGSEESETGHIAIPMIMNILLQFHNEIHLFTRSSAEMEFDKTAVHIHKYSKPFSQASWQLRLVGQLIYQLKYSFGIVHSRNRIDIIIFRGSGFIIPMATAKIFGITVISKVAGVMWREQDNGSDSYKNKIRVTFLKYIQHTTHKIADVLMAISPRSVEFAEIEDYEHKIHIWCHYFFDLNQFSIQTPFQQRDLVIGQVGTISKTKGSLEFIEVMNKVQQNTNAKALIVGDGPLADEAKSKCECLGIDAEFTGRVNRDKIPMLLNRMRINVISSKSEGLPKIAIESMACGTPVVATPVGGLPDIIDDSKNGFLTSSDDKDALTNEVLSAVNNHDLDQISKNSREFVENNYSYKSAVEGYYSLITEGTNYTLPSPSKNPEIFVQI